jgi:hypothetical protein
MKFEIEDDQQDAAPAERELVPPGIHEMTIVHCEEGPNEWKTSDTNPEGMCLKLRLSLGQYKFVFDDIPQHLGWRAKQLAAALGTGPDGETLELTPEDLIDQVVRVEISTYHSKAGKTSSVVKKYLPAAAAADKPKPAKKAPKLTPAVALASVEDEDDIPF